MIIRTAQESDKPAIIQLLKKSLGESLLKKSQTVWDFKHVANPFGSSPVWLAEEHNQLIGVRAFMAWHWQTGSKVWQAYRAVDTATHPDYQGKGIFRTLTLKALEAVAQKGSCFIFNTPNEKSRPGYLKMGWKVIDRLSLAVVPVPFVFFWGLFARRQDNRTAVPDEVLQRLCEHHNSVLAQTNKLFTPKSAAYLNWRYAQNPMQDYKVFADENSYLALYCKKHNYFTELRVAEVIYTSERELRALRKRIVQQALVNKCLIITVANKKMFTLQWYGKFGPALTFHPNTSAAALEQHAMQLNNWSYSLGDLELF